MHHDEVDMPTVMRLRRQALDLSQSELAKRVGVGSRQIARYEAGEQQPTFNVAMQIAAALSLSLDELSGRYAVGIDLSGSWWTCWQFRENDFEYFNIQVLEAVNEPGGLILNAEEGSSPVQGASFAWDGHMKRWPNDFFTGWYSGTIGEFNPIGTIVLKLDPGAESMIGIWAGQNHHDEITTGAISLARTSALARSRLIEEISPFSQTDAASILELPHE